MNDSPSAVLFDLGGVLFKFDPERRAQFIADSAGLPLSEVEARVFDTDFTAHCDTGALDDAASHTEFCRLLGVDWSYHVYQNAMAHAYEPDGIVFGLARELAAIRPVASLSNNSHTIKAALPRLQSDFAEIFSDRRFYSADFGHLKPGPEGFNAVCKRWGKQPSDILFIDDSSDNVTAAANLGFFVHRFFDAQTLETDLRGFGLL